jgi:hypothetical protein
VKARGGRGSKNPGAGGARGARKARKARRATRGKRKKRKAVNQRVGMGRRREGRECSQEEIEVEGASSLDLSLFIGEMLQKCSTMSTM